MGYRKIDLPDETIAVIDAFLVDAVDGHWRKVARIIGQTMAAMEGRAAGVPDWYYAGRLKRLVAVGLLEAKGNVLRPRFSEVRLPQDRSGGRRP